MAATPESMALKLDTARGFMAIVDELPTVPSLVMRIVGKLDDPDVSIDEITDLLLQDQVLTTRVLRLISSPYFSPLQHLRTMKEAIVYLGLDCIKEAVFTCSVIDLFRATGDGLHRSAIWAHALGVAQVSKTLAEQVEYPNAFSAYVAGLLHDIGAVFLSSYRGKEFKAAVSLAQTEGIGLYESENRLFGVSHCEIGAVLAVGWQVDKPVTDSILFHHDLESAPAENAPLVAIISLADMFCSSYGYGYEEGDRSRLDRGGLDEHRAWTYLQGALQRQVVPQEVLQRLKHSFKRIKIGIDEMFPK